MARTRSISSIETEITKVSAELQKAQEKVDDLTQRLLELQEQKQSIETKQIMDAFRKSGKSMQELMKYMLNAYRVLLTRARSGMVICVPYGNPNKNVSGFWEDSTRLPEYYNGTYEYLKSLGIEEI